MGEGWAWLNPPYANIRPWVARAYGQSRGFTTMRRKGANIAMLVPAGVGANWWRDYVDKKAMVWFLNGRLTFVGCETCYPKDCALLLYGPDVAPGYDVWHWQS